MRCDYSSWSAFADISAGSLCFQIPTVRTVLRAVQAASPVKAAQLQFPSAAAVPSSPSVGGQLKAETRCTGDKAGAVRCAYKDHQE